MKSIKKNQSGFGAVEILLVIIIVGVLGFVGWYVWHTKQATNNTTTSSTTTITQSKPTYSLPSNWSEIKCNGGGLKANLAYPNTDKAANCDDRTNTVLIDFGTYPANKCMTASEVSEANKTKPISNYTCSEITINGVKVLKTSEDTGGGQMINYDFNHSPQLHITYFADASGKLPEASTVETLAQSVKF